MAKQRQTYCRSRLGGVLLAAAVSMSMAEFIEVQRLSSDDLRGQFGLAGSCEPTITALATDPAKNLVTVAVSTGGPSPEQPPALQPRLVTANG